MSVMAETEIGHYENCNACHHPMTAHTETKDGNGVPYLVCARFVFAGPGGGLGGYNPCGCRIRNS